MALIPGYEYDIFISYAHLDNATFPGQTDGWIKQFYENLNLMLAKRFGRMGMVKIWWDSKKLDGSVLFDDSIAEGIKKSAIMISLNSSSYQASDYCKLELETFYNTAKNDGIGLNVKNRSRVIHVLLNNVPYQEWPKELSGTSGFPFHDAKEADDFGDCVDTTSEAFRNEMRNLRDAVWHLLTDFPKEEVISNTLNELKSVEEDDAFTIFLGAVSQTLRSPRKRIIAELEKKGFKIIGDVPPPDEAEAHEKAAKEAIQKAQLTIHLLDQYEGAEILGSDGEWFPKKQAEIAMETSVPQMIWMPSEIDYDEVEEPEYKTFLENIEAGNVFNKKYEFIKGPKSSLANEIIVFAEELKDKQHEQIVEDGPLSVLLDTHFNDQIYAMDLSKALLQNKIQPYINPQEDDPKKNMQMLGDRMSQVKKLIFLYGNSSKEWVIERMNAALQLMLKNNYPIEDFFIYMAPPHKEADDLQINQRLLKINIVNQSKDSSLDTDALDKFLSDLKAKAK